MLVEKQICLVNHNHVKSLHIKLLEIRSYVDLHIQLKIMCIHDLF